MLRLPALILVKLFISVLLTTEDRGRETIEVPEYLDRSDKSGRSFCGFRIPFVANERTPAPKRNPFIFIKQKANKIMSRTRCTILFFIDFDSDDGVL